MRVPRGLRVAAFFLTSVFFIFGIFIPVFRILGEHGIQIRSLFSPEVLTVVHVTFFQAAASTAVSCLLGLAIAYFWGRGRAGLSLLRVPFILPSVVIANAALGLLGSRGLGISYSLKAVVWTHVWVNAPWIALLLIEAAHQVPEVQILAARSLGAGKWSRFRTLLWPYWKWTLGSGAIQVFSLCAASFGIVLLLGGGPPVDTLETAVYASLRFGSLDLGSASAFAIWQMVFGTVPLLVLSFFSSRRRNRLDVTAVESRMGEGDERAFRWKIFIPIFFILPFFFSFSGLHWSEGLFNEMMRPFLTSVFLSLATATLSLLFLSGLLLFPFRIRSFLAQAPAAASPLILGLGFWLSYSRFIDPFEGSYLAVIFIQAVLFVPLGYRMLWPEIQNQQTPALEAALSLGASPVTAFWTVEAPRLAPTLVNIFALTAGLSVGEVAVASLFQSDRMKPLSVWMAEQLIRYRFEDAQWGALILMMLAIVLGSRKTLLRRKS